MDRDGLGLSNLVYLLLVLVVRPGAPSSVLAPWLGTSSVLSISGARLRAHGNSAQDGACGGQAQVGGCSIQHWPSKTIGEHPHTGSHADGSTLFLGRSVLGYNVGRIIG